MSAAQNAELARIETEVGAFEIQYVDPPINGGYDSVGAWGPGDHADGPRQPHSTPGDLHMDTIEEATQTCHDCGHELGHQRRCRTVGLCGCGFNHTRRDPSETDDD